MKAHLKITRRSKRPICGREDSGRFPVVEAHKPRGFFYIVDVRYLAKGGVERSRIVKLRWCKTCIKGLLS